DKGILRAKYRYCDKGVYNISSLNSSTGNLFKHLKSHPDKTTSSINKQANFMIKFLNKDSNIIFSEKTFHKKLATWIVIDDQLFIIVEYSEF
ncbi:15621_t:CDS:2, partial [Funneliformis caledonium]